MKQYQINWAKIKQFWLVIIMNLKQELTKIKQFNL